MKCKLIEYTPIPEVVVTVAARVCYSDKPVGDEILKNTKNIDNGKFIRMLYQMGHLSPFEHVSFTFAIEGISRACSHQLVRHRIASYSQRSQRYINEASFNYVIPPSIAKNKEANIKYKEIMSNINKEYSVLVKLGIPKEDARYVLPNATETQLIVTFNARSLLNFFSLRCCTRAQWEIRQLANKMLIEVKKVAPNIFANAGATCKRGYCTEGKMSCSKAPLLTDLIANYR